MTNDDPAKKMDGKGTKIRTPIKTNAGDRLPYTTGERVVANLLMLYLLLAFVGVLWFILDIWIGKFTFLTWIRYQVSEDVGIQRLFQLILYGMAGGWLGGVISAARSLQEHYTATVEETGNLEKQERSRFHIEWSSRWFWGPWQGMGLALIVVALVRSGVLVFVSSPPSMPNGPVTVFEDFSTLGLGALVGLSAKDVIEKLIQALKGWLKVEEPQAAELEIKRSGSEDAIYGGDAIKFTVEPPIPVTWTMDPADARAGTIINGIYRPADAADPADQHTQTIVITATSKSDTARSASTSLVLRPDGSNP
jgi:hypothetical protein